MASDAPHDTLATAAEEFFELQNRHDPLNASLLGLTEYDALLPDLRPEADAEAVRGFRRVVEAAAAAAPATDAERVDAAVLGWMAGAAADDADARASGRPTPRRRATSRRSGWSSRPCPRRRCPTTTPATVCCTGCPASPPTSTPSASAGSGRPGSGGCRPRPVWGRPSRSSRPTSSARSPRTCCCPRGSRATASARRRWCRTRSGRRCGGWSTPSSASCCPSPAARTPSASGRCPAAAEGYRAAVARHTSLPLTPEEVHAHRARGAGAARRRLGDDRRPRRWAISDPAEVRAALRADPGLRFETREQIVATVTEALTVPWRPRRGWSPTSAIGACTIEEIDPEEADSAALAYYRPPSDDGSRPGAHCVLTVDPTARFRFEYEALAFHEACPATTCRSPRPRRSPTCPATAATSTRSSGPTSRAGVCTPSGSQTSSVCTPRPSPVSACLVRRLRACRLVVDTGMHAWAGPRRAMAFMRENTATPEANVRNEIDRYIGWPGQALAYMTGKREILRLREEPGPGRRPVRHRRVPRRGAGGGAVAVDRPRRRRRALGARHRLSDRVSADRRAPAPPAVPRPRRRTGAVGCRRRRRGRGR